MTDFILAAVCLFSLLGILQIPTTFLLSAVVIYLCGRQVVLARA